jgi:predicted RND superfamily exporter protein
MRILFFLFLSLTLFSCSETKQPTPSTDSEIKAPKDSEVSGPDTNLKKDTTKRK